VIFYCWLGVGGRGGGGDGGFFFGFIQFVLLFLI
jgi:hypothetical protein